MPMTEQELMELVGRLYVGTVVRDREIQRLRALLAEYERMAREGGGDDVPEGD